MKRQKWNYRTSNFVAYQASGCYSGSDSRPLGATPVVIRGFEDLRSENQSKSRYSKIITIGILILIIPLIIGAVNTRTINPYSFLIGNCAVESSENIYSINPASIGILSSSVLYQNFSLNKNSENILFSQNMIFKLSSHHTFLLGYSMMEENTISVKNSMTRLTYALSFGNFLCLGANCNYRDEHYKKFYKDKLKTDLGLIISLKIVDFIKFINFGIYGLDANVEKISLKFPNVNYGKYSALGFALGLGISKNRDLILSADANLVRDGHILGSKTKIYKYGGQLNFGGSAPWLTVKASEEYYKNDLVGYSAGGSIDLKFFTLSFANKYDYFCRENNNVLSVSFRLLDRTKAQDKGYFEEKDQELKLTYYKYEKNYRI